MKKILLLCCLNSMAFAEENYMARFNTLNSQLNGTISGSATLYFKDDVFKSYVRFFAGYPDTWHMQNIFTGNRCPTVEDDLNQDGHIDIVEAYQVLGKIIIPLDGDINSQAGGNNIFPLGDAWGSYSYEKEANEKSFLRDLKSSDPNPDDNIVKLGRDEKLNLNGRAVLIQGISAQTILPESVATTAGRPIHQTLPIACGILSRTHK